MAQRTKQTKYAIFASILVAVSFMALLGITGYGVLDYDNFVNNLDIRQIDNLVSVSNNIKEYSQATQDQNVLAPYSNINVVIDGQLKTPLDLYTSVKPVPIEWSGAILEYFPKNNNNMIYAHMFFQNNQTHLLIGTKALLTANGDILDSMTYAFDADKSGNDPNSNPTNGDRRYIVSASQVIVENYDTSWTEIGSINYDSTMREWVTTGDTSSLFAGKLFNDNTWEAELAIPNERLGLGAAVTISTNISGSLPGGVVADEKITYDDAPTMFGVEDIEENTDSVGTGSKDQGGNVVPDSGAKPPIPTNAENISAMLLQSKASKGTTIVATVLYTSALSINPINFKIIPNTNKIFLSKNPIDIKQGDNTLTELYISSDVVANYNQYTVLTSRWLSDFSIQSTSANLDIQPFAPSCTVNNVKIDGRIKDAEWENSALYYIYIPGQGNELAELKVKQGTDQIYIAISTPDAQSNVNDDIRLYFDLSNDKTLTHNADDIALITTGNGERTEKKLLNDGEQLSGRAWRGSMVYDITTQRWNAEFAIDYGKLGLREQKPEIGFLPIIYDDDLLIEGETQPGAYHTLIGAKSTSPNTWGDLKGNLACLPAVIGEQCNGIDDDNNGIIDDVRGANSVESTACQCYNDGTPKIEECNAIDDDCDGKIDENFDADSDGYPEIALCLLTYGQSNVGLLDCNDDDATVNPGAEEICDGKDNACDGKIDNVNGGTSIIETACGCYGIGLSAAKNETLNGIDDNCDGILLDKEIDHDKDGFSAWQGDCNDNSTYFAPNITEICINGQDDNCNFEIDEGCKPANITQQIIPKKAYLGDGLCAAPAETQLNACVDCGCPTNQECVGNVCELIQQSAVCGNNIKESGESCDGTSDIACDGLCDTDCSCTYIIGDGVCDASEGETIEASPLDCKKESPISLFVLILIGSIAGTIGAAYFFMQQHKASGGADLFGLGASNEAGAMTAGPETKPAETPEEYVEQATASGTSVTQIKKIMLTRGWPEEEVDKLLAGQAKEEASKDVSEGKAYVKELQAQGIGKTEIKEQLEKSGWKHADIKNLFPKKKHKA